MQGVFSCIMRFAASSIPFFLFVYGILPKTKIKEKPPRFILPAKCKET